MHNKTNEAQDYQQADDIRKMDLDYMAKHRPNAKARERFLRPAYPQVDVVGYMAKKYNIKKEI